MRLHTIFTPAAVVIALTVASTPAFADQRERAGRGGDHDRSDRGDTRDRAVERARPHAEVAPRTDERPQVFTPRAVPRPEVIAPRVERPVVVAPRVERPVIVSPRFERPREWAPHYEPRYVPRHYSYGYGYPVYQPYVFRPRLRINFGIWLGYSVPYVYAYPVPVYGYYAPRAPVFVGPESTMYGGVSLEIAPCDALVYVDGSYAGTAREFDGTNQPLTLAVGMHHIEIQANGRESLAMDVMVQPGQVIPYRGDMRPW